jgi:type II secretory pathway component PulJ
MIAMSIFAVMSVMIMSVYIGTTETSRQLDLSRQLSETAREITERLSADIAEKGIGESTYDDKTVGNGLWKNTNYSGSGGEILRTGDDAVMYVF